MSIGGDEVRRIAGLAKLDLGPEDETLADSLQSILEYVARLDQLDVTDVPPTTFGSVAGPRAREDEPREGLTVEEALRNAPDTDNGRFRVPGVLDG